VRDVKVRRPELLLEEAWMMRLRVVIRWAQPALQNGGEGLKEGRKEAILGHKGDGEMGKRRERVT
jgi:hypothetical protein